MTVYVDVEKQLAMLGRAGLLVSNLTSLDEAGSPVAQPAVAARAAAEGIAAADLQKWVAWASTVGAGIPTFPINTGTIQCWGQAAVFWRPLVHPAPGADGIDIGGTSIVVRNVVRHEPAAV